MRKMKFFLKFLFSLFSISQAEIEWPVFRAAPWCNSLARKFVSLKSVSLLCRRHHLSDIFLRLNGGCPTAKSNEIQEDQDSNETEVQKILVTNKKCCAGTYSENDIQERMQIDLPTEAEKFESNESEQRNNSSQTSMMSPSQLAWFALQKRLMNNFSHESMTSSKEHDNRSVVEPFFVRLKRLKYYKRGQVAGDSKSAASARVTKGLPRHVWNSVLHKATCQHVEENGQRCSVVPKFGNAAVGIAVLCKRHRTLGQVDVRSPLCARPGCPKHPIFGPRAGGAAMFCKTHRQKDYATDCINRQCAFVEGCRLQASYAESGSQVPLYCRRHKGAAHVNIRKAWCIGAPTCRTQPSFGPRGGAALYCAAHRVAGHVNLVSRLCQHPDGCTRIPSFGEEADGIVKFCAAHRDRSGEPEGATSRLREGASRTD